MQARKGDVAVTWEDGATTSPDEVRVELVAMGPPPASQIAQAVALGRPGPDFHTSTRGVDRWLVLDPTGVRHLDRTPRRRVLRRRLNPNVSFTIGWEELVRVALQVQHGRGLVMLRLILTPVNPADFGGRRPELQPLRGLTGLGPDEWALSLNLDDHIDPYVRDTVVGGLHRFAGGRFNGEIGEG